MQKIDAIEKTHSRLSFILIIILCLHTVVILGVGFFIAPPQARPAKRIDITLSNFSEKTSPVDADYLAASNQSASGILSNKQELTTNKMPLLAHPFAQNDPQIQKTARATASTQKKQTTGVSDQQTLLTEIPDQQELTLSGDDTINQKQSELAALKAKLAEQKQTFARLPNANQLPSVATRESADAAYLLRWQHRIEEIGNHYYPKESRELKQFGDLEMIVKIGAKGELISATITQSSGFPSLDKAALRIVTLASPFEPLPQAILKETTVLEIMRTWQFKQRRL